MTDATPTIRCVRCGIPLPSGDRCERCAASANGDVPEPRDSVLRFVEGFSAPFRALRLLLEPGSGLIRYFVLPFLVSVGLMVVLLIAGWWGFFGLLDHLFGENDSAAEAVGRGLAVVGFTIVFFIFAYYFFHVLGLLVVGPFLEPLSRRVEANVLGARDPDRQAEGIFREAVWSVSQAVGLIIIMVSAGVLSILLNLCVPVGGQVLSVLVMAFAFALEYLDFSLARKRYGLGEKMGFLFRNKAAALGLGLGIWLLLLIPGGVLIVIPVSAMGATLVFLDTPWMTSGEFAPPSE